MVAGPTLEATLKLVSDKYGEKVLELQTVRGSTIDDLTVLRYIAMTSCTSWLHVYGAMCVLSFAGIGIT